MSPAGIEQARSSLAQVALEAGKHGIRVALEFQARAAFCNNLQTAAALVAEVASPQLGLCLDVFHYYVGPSKLEDLAHVTSDNLFHVQLSDLVDVPRELARDSDRILPGDGDLLLEPIIQHLQARGLRRPRVGRAHESPNLADSRTPVRRSRHDVLAKVLQQARMA